MKKYNTPIMEVSRFDTENVVTGPSGFETSPAYEEAKGLLKGASVAENDILTFTF